MTNREHHRPSFTDTLSRVEALEKALEAMFEPSPGWVWQRKPSEHVSGRATLCRPTGPGDGEWEPYYAVYVSQGGGAGDRPTQRRPVAYDRDGHRYILSKAEEGRSEPRDSGGWAQATLFWMEPDRLAPDQVAFVGIEERPDDSDG